MRPAAVAGTFYPGERGELERTLDALLRAPAIDTAPAKAFIVPHAGYVYSGPVAATVYAAVAKARATITRVVLLGPAHRVPVAGLAHPADDAFATPLGVVGVERCTLPHVTESELAHRWEHSLEVQLPFLQRVLGEFTLLPLVVGDASTEQVSSVLEAVWGGEETLVLISSDLSHFLGYDDARAADRATADRILALDPSLSHTQACGATPVNGLLALARRLRLCAELLDLRNSHDTARDGDRRRVVGYGAFRFAAAS